jgi:hypothetical protein
MLRIKEKPTSPTSWNSGVREARMCQPDKHGINYNNRHSEIIGIQIDFFNIFMGQDTMTAHTE